MKKSANLILFSGGARGTHHLQRCTCEGKRTIPSCWQLLLLLPGSWLRHQQTLAEFASVDSGFGIFYVSSLKSTLRSFEFCMQLDFADRLASYLCPSLLVLIVIEQTIADQDSSNGIL